MTTSKKIVLLGHFGVGKTSIIRKFVTNEFSSDYKVTIGVHILKKEVPVTNGEDVSLIIWDLEGTDNIDLIAAANRFVQNGNKDCRAWQFGTFSERDKPKCKPSMRSVNTQVEHPL